MKIGLTGSIACGKSTVSAYLRELGYTVIDADAISHEITAPDGIALPVLRSTFGEKIFDGDILNRQALGKIVFSSSSLREKLNAVLHPIIIAEINKQIDQHDSLEALVFADIPLLYECSMEHLFDLVWVVSASRQTQILRLRERNGLCEADAVRRIDSQLPLFEKEKLADAVICTEGSIEETHAQIRALIADIQTRRNV